MSDIAAMQRALALLLLDPVGRRTFLYGGPLPSEAGLDDEDDIHALRNTLARQREGVEFFATLLDRKRDARVMRLFPATALLAPREFHAHWQQWSRGTDEAVSSSAGADALRFGAWLLHALAGEDERIEGAIRFDRARLLAQGSAIPQPRTFEGDPARARVYLRKGTVMERLEWDYAAMLRAGLPLEVRRPATYIFQADRVVRLGTGAANLLTLAALKPVDLNTFGPTREVLDAVEALRSRGIIELQEAGA